MSIQMLEWWQVVSIQYLKLNANSYDVIEIDNYVILNTSQNIHFARIFYFCLSIGT